MTSRGRVSILLAVVTIAAVLAGCTPASRPPVSVGATASRPTLRSEDETETARKTLEAFFGAWVARDPGRWNRLVTPKQVTRSLDAEIKVGPITPVAASEPSVPETGGPYEYRAFSATIRFYGDVLSVAPGEPQDWTWFVVRGADGRWLVHDWGY